MLPERVVVPAPFCVSDPPERDALMAPLVVVALVAVNTPLPVMVPLPRATAPTVSEKLERSRVPPLTVTAPPASALLLAPMSLPLLMVVPPV